MVHDRGQRLPGGSVTGLDGETMQDRRIVQGKGGRIHVGRQQALRDGGLKL